MSYIQALLIENGASEADGTASYHGRLVSDKVRNGLQYCGDTDLLFVHRDADTAGSVARYEEIGRGVSAAGYGGRWVGMVPVRMMEAWLLADEAAIRRVAGRPRGTEALDLPKPDQLENLSNPKQTLREVLLKAGAPRGVRRTKRFKADFGSFLKQLAENLPVGRPLEQISAWMRFRDDVAAAMGKQLQTD
ncbi:MAG: hypothetical protein OXQ31_00275 [Spirochaetaceae bacterium]|nr:hypothetical protein [Spirochaetaceae bacterium]